MKEKVEYLKPVEVAKMIGVTAQTVHTACKRGRLEYNLNICGYKIFTIAQVMAWREGRYNKSLSLHKGKPLFNLEKGEISVNAAAEILGVENQTVYYYIRRGLLKYTKKKSTYILNVDEIQEFKEKYVPKIRLKE